jgi:hypothetical protein
VTVPTRALAAVRVLARTAVLVSRPLLVPVRTAVLVPVLVLMLVLVPVLASSPPVRTETEAAAGPVASTPAMAAAHTTPALARKVLLTPVQPARRGQRD